MTWKGNEALRLFLVPVETLKPDRGNPRRGDVDVIAESLARFGQQRPVLAAPNGTVVAGNHTLAAARQRGWTHIAVLRTELRGKQQKAYGLADNRTGDLGVYDEGRLAELLRGLETFAGTGYTDEDRELYEALAALRAEETADDEGILHRIMLRYPRDEYLEVTRALDAIIEEHDLDTYSDAAAMLMGADEDDQG